MVEQQINPVFLAADFQRVLATYKREARAQLHQEVPNMRHQPPLQVLLLRRIAQGHRHL